MQQKIMLEALLQIICQRLILLVQNQSLKQINLTMKGLISMDKAYLSQKLQVEETLLSNSVCPFFQGGAVNSRRKQAYSQYERTNENTLFTQRRIIQEVRSEFSNVITLVANVTAQKQAVTSATSALEATKVGYKVGTRNVVDLLQAEKNLYSAEKNLANAKYDYILSNLKLALASGTITPGDLVRINSLLK